MSENQSQITIPANSIRLFLPVQLLTIINAKSGSESQLSATWILKTLTENLKDDIIRAYGQKAFDFLIAKYSKTAIEQTQDNIVKKQERLEKRKKREDLEREKLEVKRKELEIRQQNADSRVDYNPTEKEKELNRQISILELEIDRAKQEGKDISELEERLREKLFEREREQKRK